MDKWLCKGDLPSKSALCLTDAALSWEAAVGLETLEKRIDGRKAANDKRLSQKREKSSLRSDGAWMPWLIRIPMS